MRLLKYKVWHGVALRYFKVINTHLLCVKYGD